MAFSFARFGNDLYTGKQSFDFVGRWRTWFAIGAAMTLLALLVLGVKGVNAGIEFRGGSEFIISGVENSDQGIARDVVGASNPGGEVPRVTVVGADSVRVQTERLTDDETDALRAELAQGYDVEPSEVTSSFVGPSWGSDVTGKALTSLLVFSVLVSIVITLYFRSWQMAVAALVALLHDLIITAGVYAATGFEVTPATVIGFLTILGYSLYDTVVVFDKVRENTSQFLISTKRNFAESTNLAVNQTLVRSINTSVVALLPVAAILFIGAFLLGAGTLKDISLALFVGILAGTYSSVFIAPAILVLLRRRDTSVKEHEKRVLKAREVRNAAPSAELATAGARTSAGAGAPASSGLTAGSGSPTGSTIAPARAAGPRNQPRRPKGQRPSGKRR